MEITDTSIDGLKVLKPSLFGDTRGYYTPRFVIDDMKKLGFAGVVQISRSMSNKGVLRGLHFQQGKHAQAKIAEVIQGKALDVAVDMRKDSKTYGKAAAIVLAPVSEPNGGLMFYIPRGFAHGYLALEDNTIFQYYIDNDWCKDAESGINWRSAAIPWNDILRSFNIEKPLTNARDEAFELLETRNT